MATKHNFKQVVKRYTKLKRNLIIPRHEDGWISLALWVMQKPHARL